MKSRLTRAPVRHNGRIRSLVFMINSLYNLICGIRLDYMMSMSIHP